MNALLVILAIAGSFVDVTWTADEVPEIESGPLGDRIVLQGAPSVGLPGEPLFPAAPVTVLLPEGAVADRVEILGVDTGSTPFTIDPMPAQAGVPISMPEAFRITARRSEAYQRSIEMSAVLQGQGTLMGYPIADIMIRPFSWDHTTRRTEFCESMSLRIHYHFTDSYSRIPERGIVGSRVVTDIVASTVINPEDMPITVPREELPWGEYLIIADDDIAVSFEPLAMYKTWKGVQARIVTLSYITDIYPGVDDAQKVRNFLYEIFQDTPPTYVLLAGDTPGVPHRNCYATAEGYVGDPSSDLYFQDMNDTAPGVDAWNLDGDATWGELNGDDNMDYHPDYILGRASVESAAEAEIFIDKVMAWEDAPDSDNWYNAMGFTTGILWSSPYCPGSAGKEKVDTLYTPAGWDITKLYQSAGTQSYTATMAMLNTGMQLVNHAGHGSNSSVSIGTGSLTNSDFMGLTNIANNGRPSVWNTIACLSGSFDTGTCLAEAWIRSPGGGGFCIMNTRYGWGEPAEPGDQWSELVDQEFFAKFFTEDMHQVGVAYMMAKDEFIPLIPSDTHYDWIAKSNTLFGDPEISMYTQVPDTTEVGGIMLCEGLQEVTISVTSDGSPLQDARVCLIQGEWNDPVIYEVGITGPAGTVTLDWPGEMPAVPDTARVTVWARDHVLWSQVLEVGNLGTGSESGGLVPTMSIASPNPAAGTASIAWSLPGTDTGTISIVDLAGRTVTQTALEGGSGTYSWNTSECPAGIYFIRMTTVSGQELSSRLVVVR